MLIDQDLPKCNKPRKDAGLQRVNNSLNNVISNLGLEQRLREHALLSLWPVVAGDLASSSRAIWIDYQGSLVVAVADASTGQELSLSKSKILKKLQTVANTIGVCVKALRFDMKRYYDQSESLDLKSEDHRLPSSMPDDIDSVLLSDDDLAALEQLEIDLKLDKEINKEAINTISGRILQIFEKELRIRRWRILNGFPMCSSCLLPTPMLYGDKKFCMPCFFAS